ncbi:hypothetical protein [Phreatobacter sp.]|uniref:hypothetical protein n=1 Tax=Phreatobacter sp. TaxID=1966341 RepID=UPI0022CC23BB|nr:hypothetical protein [Phreatobacter sp.]MCZ8315138.1 hypothetical protein [Phreatobacter sp.]
MKVRKTAVTVTVLAAACLALTLGASVMGDERGLALSLRCWLGPPVAVCHDLARERENRALQAVEKELRDLNRLAPPACVDPASDTTMPCPR